MISTIAGEIPGTRVKVDDRSPLLCIDHPSRPRWEDGTPSTYFIYLNLKIVNLGYQKWSIYLGLTCLGQINRSSTCYEIVYVIVGNTNYTLFLRSWISLATHCHRNFPILPWIVKEARGSIWPDQISMNVKLFRLYLPFNRRFAFE